jgi:hypothetical protein
MGYTTSSSTRDCIQWMAISGQTGQTYNITYEVIYHMEQQSGMDVGVEDASITSGPDVLTGDPSDIALAARHVPAFAVGDIEDIASTLMQTFSDVASRNIPSLAMEGGLVRTDAVALPEPSSSSTSAPPKPAAPVALTKEKWMKIAIEDSD